MSSGDIKVLVLHPDAAVAQSVVALVQSMKLDAARYATPEELLEVVQGPALGCLVLGLRLPGMTGLEVQGELRRRQSLLPIIFLTTHADVASAVAAMKAGAIDYLETPFRPHELWTSIQAAIQRSRTALDEHQQWLQIEERMQRLTPGERQVFDMLVGGKSKATIAKELALSTRTIEVRRAKLMRKLKVQTLADMIRLAVKIEMRATVN